VSEKGKHRVTPGDIRGHEAKEIPGGSGRLKKRERRSNRSSSLSKRDRVKKVPAMWSREVGGTGVIKAVRRRGERKKRTNCRKLKGEDFSPASPKKGIDGRTGRGKDASYL